MNIPMSASLARRFWTGKGVSPLGCIVMCCKHVLAVDHGACGLPVLLQSFSQTALESVDCEMQEGGFLPSLLAVFLH